VALGHRRLSIIDLSTGQQPLFNEDGSVAVVFNGEIYNFQELVPELEALGHVFHTRSDTEVIVHAWEAWGEACVQRFRGMFAFGLWDRNRQTFFLARDRLGVKPLYYAARRRHAGLRLRAQGADAAPGPRSAHRPPRGRRILRPRLRGRAAHDLPGAQAAAGETLCIRRGQPIPAPRSYWDVRSPSTTPVAGRRLRRTHRAPARIRPPAHDRRRAAGRLPVRRRRLQRGGGDHGGLSGDPVSTCSIAFDDPAFNESAFAQMVADRYQTRHYVETVKSDDFDLIDTLAALYDEPYADSSAIPTYRVCQLARKHVTVALSGDGGDESFGGYRRYRMHLMEEKMRGSLPAGVRRPLFGMLGRMYPKADWAPRVFRAKTTFQALARDSVQAYFHSVSILRDDMRRSLFSSKFGASWPATTRSRCSAATANAQTDDPLALIQYLDIKTYLVGDINTKVDRASMAHSSKCANR
jgi:asparagine synthase (glutamine-hydrolysing)